MLMEEFYRTTTLKNLPVHDVFNRTCIFEPVGKSNQAMTRTTEYVDTVYKVVIDGFHLNCSVDYPLFAMLVAQFVNNKIDDLDSPQVATIPLNKIIESIGVSGIGTRDADFKKIYDSLARLENTKISYTNQKSKLIFEGVLIKNSKLDFKNKSLTVTFTRLILDLYDQKSLKKSEVSFMNIQELTGIKTESAKALYRFIVTQNKDYIDFTFKRLSMVLGYHYRAVAGKKKAKQEEKTLPLKDSKKREYLKAALNKLITHEVVSEFHYFEELQRYRILQKVFYPNFPKGKDILALESNIERIKQVKVKENKLDQEESFPFDLHKN